MYYIISYELDGESHTYSSFFSSLKDAATQADRLVRKLGRKVGKVLDIQEALSGAYFYGDSGWYSSYSAMSTDNDAADFRIDNYYNTYNSNSANSTTSVYEAIRNVTNFGYGYTEEFLSSQVMNTIASTIDDIIGTSIHTLADSLSNVAQAVEAIGGTNG